MAVRAKCRVTGRNERNGGGYDKSGKPSQVEVTLQPVYGEGEDDSNKQWSQYTPSGELRLCITNPEAYEQFKLGQTFFVDFTPADER